MIVMNSKTCSYYLKLALAALLLVLGGCEKSPSTGVGSYQQEKRVESAADDFERGPHNGRLLHNGDFAVEITIYETGVDPEFRVYVTAAGKPLEPSALQLAIELHRFAGVIDRLQFAPREDYLASTTSVYEPHSFDVAVLASYQGKSHRWTYSSHEGRTTIDAAAAKAAGIEIAAAGAGTIEERSALYGTIQPDPTRVRSVAARFPGAIRGIDVALGERVHAGQRLALVESNESLQTYAVKAPITGVVTQRRGNPGETTDTSPLFEIADHSQVVAVLNVFPRDRGRISIGQSISVRAADGAARGQGVVAAISTGSATPAALAARVVLDNSKAEWTPGQIVDAQATIAKFDAPVVVPLTAVQHYRDGDTVFLNKSERYQAQPVKLGRRDGEHVEVLGGLTAGMRVVVVNSYVVKADIEKSGASHDH
jgi:membrane fusion protein, heavy metal efflux system